MKRAAVWLLLAPLGALAADDLPPLQQAPAEYARRAAAAAPCATGDVVALTVAADARSGLEATYDAARGRLRILYRMAFNQLTEGWNWHPERALAGDDYYTYKYLPLASVDEDRGTYRAEDKIGSPQEFRVQWRTDYFFAFDNPYGFYPHDADDDAGFVADVAVPAAEAARLAGGDLRMALSGRLGADCISDSTTFWKATSAAPVDFTLKKRYLIGKLAAVWFYDAASGRVLARLPATPAQGR
ncbi:hypothetical protein [Sulfurisoma sediminicola]|uniref:DUF3298 domain-containing protein n=1 Tax=Sulfurisoma sediminicola TaxID=1381557 RepID=A0A497X902_9PROT|nr:hypothetical protein [Sulfurisoma sediminicola]RLJ62721.1 hypothetical protein DFR35_2537 [Sulfurisoma sediminicola]